MAAVLKDSVSCHSHYLPTYQLTASECPVFKMLWLYYMRHRKHWEEKKLDYEVEVLLKIQR